jgi:hypothetical protein
VGSALEKEGPNEGARSAFHLRGVEINSRRAGAWGEKDSPKEEIAKYEGTKRRLFLNPRVDPRNMVKIAPELGSAIKLVSRDSLYGGEVAMLCLNQSEPHLPTLYLTGMQLKGGHLGHVRDMPFSMLELQLHALSLRPVTVLLV